MMRHMVSINQRIKQTDSLGNVYGRCIIVVYCLGRPTGVHVGSSINLQTKQANANYSFLYGTCHFLLYVAWSCYGADN